MPPLPGLQGFDALLERALPTEASTEFAIPGRRFGPWQLLHKIGEGGMGEVWLGRRDDGAYTGWQLYVWNAPGEALGGWPGRNPGGTDTFGVYWDVPVTSTAFNFIIHNGDSTREPSGWSGANGDQQQLWTVADGAELWKLAGDTANYPRNPLATAAADINTVRVNYKRFDGRYADWGLHLWPDSGIDVSRLPGLTLNTWGSPVPLSALGLCSWRHCWLCSVSCPWPCPPGLAAKPRNLLP